MMVSQSDGHPFQRGTHPERFSGQSTEDTQQLARTPGLAGPGWPRAGRYGLSPLITFVRSAVASVALILLPLLGSAAQVPLHPATNPAAVAGRARISLPRPALR